MFAWIFTDEVDQAFSSFWLPFLGLIFFPWTTLMFSIAYAPIIGVTGFWGFAWWRLGVLLDIGSYSASAYQRGMRPAGSDRRTPEVVSRPGRSRPVSTS